MSHCRAPRPPFLSSKVVHTVSDMSGVQSYGRNGQRVPLERVRTCVRRGDVRTERKRNPESWRQHRLRCHFQFFKFCLLQALGFSSSVLKPDFNLGLRQVEGAGELRALGDREILLLTELSLQGEQLGRGEGGPGLSIRLVFAEWTGRRTQPSCKNTKRFNSKLCIS